MSYRDYSRSQGDPFGLGSIFSAGKRLFGAVTGLGGGGASKADIAAAMKGALQGGIAASKGAGILAGKAGAFIGKHKGMSAAVAAAIAAGAIPAGYILTHSGKVRRRGHMQVTNTRALRRSMRRVTGFAKVAKRVMTFTTHHRIKKTRRK